MNRRGRRGHPGQAKAAPAPDTGTLKAGWPGASQSNAAKPSATTACQDTRRRRTVAKPSNSAGEYGGPFQSPVRGLQSAHGALAHGE